MARHPLEPHAVRPEQAQRAAIAEPFGEQLHDLPGHGGRILRCVGHDARGGGQQLQPAPGLLLAAQQPGRGERQAGPLAQLLGQRGVLWLEEPLRDGLAEGERAEHLTVRDQRHGHDRADAQANQRLAEGRILAGKRRGIEPRLEDHGALQRAHRERFRRRHAGNPPDDLLRLGVGPGDGAQPRHSILADRVGDAVIGELRHRKARQPGERPVVVQRSGEQLAGADQEGEAQRIAAEHRRARKRGRRGPGHGALGFLYAIHAPPSHCPYCRSW